MDLSSRFFSGRLSIIISIVNVDWSVFVTAATWTVESNHKAFIRHDSPPQEMVFTIPNSRSTKMWIPVAIIAEIIDKIRITYSRKGVFACVVFIIIVAGFIIVKIVIHVYISIALWTLRCKNVTMNTTKTMCIWVGYARLDGGLSGRLSGGLDGGLVGGLGGGLGGWQSYLRLVLSTSENFIIDIGPLCVHSFGMNLIVFACRQMCLCPLNAARIASEASQTSLLNFEIWEYESTSEPHLENAFFSFSKFVIAWVTRFVGQWVSLLIPVCLTLTDTASLFMKINAWILK